MKAKFVKNVLNEKFVEDSDPIKDMGIGYKTKYRTMEYTDSYAIRKVLQYLKPYKSFWRGSGEKWINVPNDSDASFSSRYRNNDGIDERNESYWNILYITNESPRGHAYKTFKVFVDKWPNVDDYLKHVTEEYKKFIENEKRRKQQEEDDRFEYLN